MIQGDCLCKHISGHRHSMNSLPSWCLCVFAVPCVLSPELMDHCKPYHVALLLFKDDSPTHKRLCKEHRRASGVSIRASHCFPVLGSSHSTVSEITYFWRLSWAPGICWQLFTAVAACSCTPEGLVVWVRWENESALWYSSALLQT